MEGWIIAFSILIAMMVISIVIGMCTEGIIKAIKGLPGWKEYQKDNSVKILSAPEELSKRLPKGGPKPNF